MNREYHKWYTQRLARDMELLVFGHAGKPVLFFPPRMGRFYDYENWGIVGALADRISNGELHLFCVDSIDTETFYNDISHPAKRMNRHLQYEQYILNEVLPLMRSKQPGTAIEVAGCSMGAYHAANIALKNPHLFKKVVCMSGRYDITRPIQYFQDLLSGYRNEEVAFNMPRQLLSNVRDGAFLDAIRQLDIYLAIGQTDPFNADNHEFSELLWQKGIHHHFYTWNGYAHTPKYWKQMVNLYL